MIALEKTTMTDDDRIDEAGRESFPASDAPPWTSGIERQEAPLQTRADGLPLDIADVERKLRSEGACGRDGHAARTLFDEAGRRVVLVVMSAGAVTGEHRAVGATSIHALAGHLCLHLPDRVAALPLGRPVALAPGQLHKVEALAESAFLLTQEGSGEAPARSTHG